MCETKVDTQFHSFADDLRFRELQQRSLNPDVRALHACFRRDCGEHLESSQKLRPAIGIITVIDDIHSNEDVAGRNDFRPRERIGKEMVFRAGT